MKMAKDVIEVRRGPKSRKWYWRIVNANGEVLCHSETYSSKTQCADTVRRFMRDHAGFCLVVPLTASSDPA